MLLMFSVLLFLYDNVIEFNSYFHFNSALKLFINVNVFWFQEFSLIERRELAPLQELIDKLTAKEAR